MKNLTKASKFGIITTVIAMGIILALIKPDNLFLTCAYVIGCSLIFYTLIYPLLKLFLEFTLRTIKTAKKMKNIPKPMKQLENTNTLFPFIPFN